jgi:hypothetical protein
VLVAAGAGIAALIAVVWAWDPSAGPSPLPACPFRAATGWPCPGCGGTTAVHHLLWLDPAAAWAAHSAATVLLPVAAVATAVLMLGLRRGWWTRRAASRTAWAGFALALAVMLAWWLVRPDGPAHRM